MTTRPLNSYDPAYQPQFSNWMTNLRVITTDDTDPLTIPANQQIVLGSPDARVRSGSRFGINQISLLIETPRAITVKLYAIDQGTATGTTPVAFLVDSQVTGTINKMITYSNLPPLTYVVSVTGISGGDTIRIHGGGTH